MNLKPAALSAVHTGMTSETFFEGAWSAPVTDNRGYALRGRLVVRVRPRESRHREAAVFVELQDASSTIHGGMRVFCDIGRHDFRPEYVGGLRCALHDSRRRAVPATSYPFGGATPQSTWVELPGDATVRLRTSPFGVWRPGALAITPEIGTLWNLDERDRGAYFLSGTFTAAPVDAPQVSDPQIWRGTLVLPPVRLTGARR